jgi:hypothetical protein
LITYGRVMVDGWRARRQGGLAARSISETGGEWRVLLFLDLKLALLSHHHGSPSML